MEMNEAPNTNPTSGLGNTFSSQPAPQTNPFTADLNREFTSDFGTNTGTNAVSQIFKEGGFANNDKTKKIIAVVAGVVVLAVVAYVFLGDDGSYDASVPGDSETASEESAVSDDELADDEAADADEEATAEERDEEGAGEDEEYAEEGGASKVGSKQAQGTGTKVAPSAGGSKASYGYGYSGKSAGSGPITLSEPADGSTLGYDETQGGAVFSWTGGGGYISFSRNQSMNPTVLRARAPGNSYEFHHPWTGTWYWKVENASGSTEVRSFQVNEPARRNVVISEPAGGSAVSGNGGTVSWQGDNGVAFYRVELSAAGAWGNPEYRFATSGNSVSLSGVPAGQYQMRVGAFSEVSGRWEYTSPAAVSVQ